MVPVSMSDVVDDQPVAGRLEDRLVLLLALGQERVGLARTVRWTRKLSRLRHL
jgi:hypothetical protein